jgi:GH15 family glucan-1,4-alpha-glucosidase
MKHTTNNKLVTSSWTRINNAIYHLEMHLEFNKNKTKYADGKIIRLDKHTKFMIKSTIFELKNARALLVKTTFNHKDKYGRQMKRSSA